MKAALKVAGVEKTFKRLTIDENVAAIGTWDAIRAEIEALAAFSAITVERGGIEIFGGRIERPGIDFSRAGSEIRPSGFDYTIKLTDYLTPQASINDFSTLVALEILLENTPYTGVNLDIIDAFGYITDPTVYDTSLEFLQFYFSNACIEFDPDPDPPEIEDLTRVGDITSMGFTEGRSCFFYDGATKRFYMWYVEGGVLYYEYSTDGDTWTRRSSGVTPGGDRWSVAWFNSKVWLFEYDGANTDFWRGTIADDTGIITWDGTFNPKQDIFAGQIKAGPVFDDSNHIWIIRDNLNGQAYESTDNGDTWNPKFTASANTIIWGILPVGTDGDMYTFVENTATDDLEEWLWDRSAGTHTVQVIIDNMGVGETIINLDCASNADYTPNVAWHNSGDDFDWAWKPNGGWVKIRLQANAIWYLGGKTNIMLGCDGGLCAYPAMIGNFGFRIYKIKNGALVSTTTTPGTIAQPFTIQCPRSSLQDGKVAIFLQYEPAESNDNTFMLWHPTGMRLNKGRTTGYFLTNTITAGGTFVRWGYCAAEGIQLVDVDWSVRKAADNSLLGTGGQKVTFDIDIASGSTTETSIKIRADLTYVTVDPYVTEISVSEKIDEVSFETDFEDTYTGMKKWAALAGAEFWIDSAGILHVAYARGSDKSNLVFLKNSKTSDLPAVEPNIKVVSRNPDWAPYANAIYVIGAEGPPRIEVEVTDQPSIDAYGEHWYCHRDPDIQTDQMALTVGAIELARRNTVIDRIRAVILDEYDPKNIEIGDVVWVVAEFGDDVATKLNAAMRVVSLNRSWDPSGEQVSLELINLISATEYWAHLVTISDLTRWVTA